MKTYPVIRAALVCSAFMFTAALQVSGGTPLGGLAVAVSPDGSTVLAGGDNRTLYVLDAESLEVKNRVWVEFCIARLSYNKDGSVIVVGDTDGTMHLFKASDVSRTSEHKKMDKLSISREVDLAAGLEADYKGNMIKFASLTDGSEKGRVVFDKESKVSCFGLNPAGDTLAVLGASKTDEEEPKVSSSDRPKDLKGLDKEIFEQKNDGKTAVFSLFKVPSGEKIAEHKVFYTSSSSTKIYFSGDDALIVNYSNENARIKPDGRVEMFQLGNSYNYGIGAASDQSLILTGGLRDATVTKLPDMTQLTLDVGRIGGWPEYFKAFCSNAEGPCYGSTSAFRVIQFDRSGKVVKEVPCF